MSQQLVEAIEDGRPESLEGHVLVGFALVTEWVGPDGVRSLTRHSGAPHGSIPLWQAKGLHHEALYGTWSDAE
jgi:hypothetical protein